MQLPQNGTFAEIKRAMKLTGPFIPVLALLSGVVNLLGLTSSIYMLQVYDRVLGSGSVATLVALSLIALAAYGFQALLDIVRGRILSRIAAKTDLTMARDAQNAAIRLPVMLGARAARLQPLRDLDTVRTYLGSNGPTALLDLPWLPVFLIFLFALHPILGLVTLGAAAILCGLTLMTERIVSSLTSAATRAAQDRAAIVQGSERNAEVLIAMGFTGRLLDAFEAANGAYLGAHHNMSDRLNTLTVISKTFRMILQSALLGLGAYLTLKGEMTSGSIIAASISSGRALAPLDAVIASWKTLAAARQALPRLDEALSLVGDAEVPLELPAPHKELSLSNLGLAIPGTPRAVVAEVTFSLKAGTVAAIVGPSAAGKSSLVRAIVGVWPAARGSVMLDGAALGRWDRERLGRHIGYLPQDVELFDGTVAENIARFEKSPDANAVLAASSAAGVHQLILALPNGYETRIGQGGASLSAGQRQRIGLARALYGNPFVVVLDEPNSNLDTEGELALMDALRGVRERGGIAIVVSHRPNILSAVDTVITIQDGRLVGVTPRDEFVRKVVKPMPSKSPALPHNQTATAVPAE